jgi:hypothetical protein
MEIGPTRLELQLVTERKPGQGKARTGVGHDHGQSL